MSVDFYKSQFNNIKKSFAEVPSAQVKLDAFDKFYSNGWPSIKQEDFRYSKLRRLSTLELSNYEVSLEQPRSLFNHGFDFPVNNLVFRNGIFDKQLSQISRETIDLIKFKGHGCLSPLPFRSQLKNSPFYNLNISFNLETFYIDIPSNTVINEPIVFNYIYDSEFELMYHPQIDIKVGKNSQVKFIEIHENKNEKTTLINPVCKIQASENSKVKYIRLAKLTGSDSKHTGHFVSEQLQDSSLHFLSVNLGGGFNRLDCEFFHKQKNSNLEVNGLYFSKGKEQVNYLSRIFHEEGYGESHQLYKGVLDDESSSTFDGLVYIAPKAQKVNSSQMNKNLLLSDKAEVNSKPQLDINADDVKAAHGATVSELSDEEIFYLMSRGISRADAVKIIERAFIDEIILKVGDLNIQNWLRKVVQ